MPFSSKSETNFCLPREHWRFIRHTHSERHCLYEPCARHAWFGSPKRWKPLFAKVCYIRKSAFVLDLWRNLSALDNTVPTPMFFNGTKARLRKDSVKQHVYLFTFTKRTRTQLLLLGTWNNQTNPCLIPQNAVAFVCGATQPHGKQ